MQPRARCVGIIFRSLREVIRRTLSIQLSRLQPQKRSGRAGNRSMNPVRNQRRQKAKVRRDSGCRYWTERPNAIQIAPLDSIISLQAPPNCMITPLVNHSKTGNKRHRLMANLHPDRYTALIRKVLGTPPRRRRVQRIRGDISLSRTTTMCRNTAKLRGLRAISLLAGAMHSARCSQDVVSTVRQTRGSQLAVVNRTARMGVISQSCCASD